MGCKSVCKYCVCDISAIVNQSFIFTTVLMSHITYNWNSVQQNQICDTNFPGKAKESNVGIEMYD